LAGSRGVLSFCFGFWVAFEGPAPGVDRLLHLNMRAPNGLQRPVGGLSPKGAHRVRVQIGVRFQRRGFRSPIWARSWESESKEESDLLWTRESESKEESDLLWTRESESKEESDLLWTLEPESNEESDLIWTQESESKEEPDLLWTGKSDLARHLLSPDL
jgi:hypothetical protein